MSKKPREELARGQREEIFKDQDDEQDDEAKNQEMSVNECEPGELVGREIREAS